MKSLSRSFLPALVLLATLSGWCRPAFAQWAVIDAPNLGENIAKYALSAKQHMTQMAQWENQVMRAEMQAQNMVQNVETARDLVSAGPLYAVVNTLSSPMFQGTAAGDVASTLKDGIQLTGVTEENLKYSRDAIGNALMEAEHGGNGYAAQMHAGNQLLGVQAMIEMAEAQQQAALLAERLSVSEQEQLYKDASLQEARQTQYAPIQSGRQQTDTGEAICNGDVKNQYCQQPTSW